MGLIRGKQHQLQYHTDKKQMSMPIPEFTPSLCPLKRPRGDLEVDGDLLHLIPCAKRFKLNPVIKNRRGHDVHAAFSTKDMVAIAKMPHHMNSVGVLGRVQGSAPTTSSEDTCISLAHSIKVTADVPSALMCGTQLEFAPPMSMQSTGQIVNGLKKASCNSKVDIVDLMQPSTTTLKHVTSTVVCTTDCSRAVSTQYSSCVIPALGTTGRSSPIKEGTHYSSKSGSKKCLGVRFCKQAKVVPYTRKCRAINQSSKIPTHSFSRKATLELETNGLKLPPTQIHKLKSKLDPRGISGMVTATAGITTNTNDAVPMEGIIACQSAEAITEQSMECAMELAKSFSTTMSPITMDKTATCGGMACTANVSDVQPHPSNSPADKLWRFGRRLVLDDIMDVGNNHCQSKRFHQSKPECSPLSTYATKSRANEHLGGHSCKRARVVPYTRKCKVSNHSSKISTCNFSRPSQKASQKLETDAFILPQPQKLQELKGAEQKKLIIPMCTKDVEGFKVPTCPPVRIACQKKGKRSAQSAHSQATEQSGTLTTPKVYISEPHSAAQKSSNNYVISLNQQHETACSVEDLISAFTTTLKMSYSEIPCNQQKKEQTCSPSTRQLQSSLVPAVFLPHLGGEVELVACNEGNMYHTAVENSCENKLPVDGSMLTPLPPMISDHALDNIESE